jgi:hypothetical protein
VSEQGEGWMMSQDDCAELCAWAGARNIEVYQRSKTVWIAAGTYRGRELVVKGRSASIALALWMESAQYTGPRPLQLQPGHRVAKTTKPVPDHETPLATAERLVLAGSKNVARQRRRIEDMSALGHSTSFAEMILRVLEQTQIEYVAHRDSLLNSPSPSTPSPARILHLAKRLQITLLNRRHARKSLAG